MPHWIGDSTLRRALVSSSGLWEGSAGSDVARSVVPASDSVPAVDSGRGDAVVERDGDMASAVSLLGVSINSPLDDVVAPDATAVRFSASCSGRQALDGRMSSGHEELCARGGNAGGVGDVMLDGVGMVGLGMIGRDR